MYRDVFSTYLKDLNTLDQNEIVLVTYDKTKNLLEYRQLNKIILVPYLSPFFLPTRSFKIGALTPSGLANLKWNLTKLLSDNLIDNDHLVPDIKTFGLDWYRYFNDVTMPLPQIYISLKFVTITSRFWTWVTCMRFNNTSKIIYKSLIKEIKLNKNNLRNQEQFK